MPQMIYPRADAVETATQTLFNVVDRSAMSVIRRLREASAAREPVGDIYNWLGRSRSARYGHILQCAVCAAIACDQNYQVYQQVRFHSQPLSLRGSIVVDCVVRDFRADTVAAYEITADIGSRSVSGWEQRASEIRRHLGRLANQENCLIAGSPLSVITTKPGSDLSDVGIPILQVSDLKKHFGMTAGWAIKAAAERFQFPINKAMRDAGL